MQDNPTRLRGRCTSLTHGRHLGQFGITANCIAPGVIATGRIMQTVIPGSSQSNRDRAELVALRRLGTVEDCAKVVEFLATDLSDYVPGP